MRVKEILRNLNYISWKISMDKRGRNIFSLCQDSRNADPACLFFCKRGTQVDGHLYARDAYNNGARFFVVEREVDLPEDAAVITVKDSGEELKRLSVIFYGDPCKELNLIGITGTKGKTTVALSVYKIAQAYGKNVGYIGTNGVYYGGRVFETANTTPDCLELQKLLREMKDNGVTDVILEVSSQALWQERTYGLNFEICAFTNLYEDHIGGVEHPTMLHYKKCKKKLFTDYDSKYIVVNSDSPATQYMMRNVDKSKVITTSAKGNSRCDVYALEASKRKEGILPGVGFRLLARSQSPVRVGGRGFDTFIPIPGLYSVENALLTFAICSLMGIAPGFIVDEFSRLAIPGRFESVQLDRRPNSLFIIDYAHNGASLKAVMDSLREYEPKRIILVFGSVGGRTFGRREELGRVADKEADVIIITSDNPNNEAPMKIIEDINAAIKDRDKPIYLIPDRKKAVEKAYEIAEDGDFVLLAGKGHENYQLVCGAREPFSERRILERVNALNIVFQ